MISIPVTIQSDEKGYFDRECPNENCLYAFKIKMRDWEEKVSDEKVHCPMCGHVDTSDKWWTQQQLDEMEELAANWAADYIGKELDKVFGNLAKSTRRNKFIKITYKPGKRISFINNPIGQSEEWELEITCDNCGTQYSVIGSAYFCPCCGYNSASRVFDESLDTVEKMLSSLPKMREMFSEMYGKDKADTMCRGILESTLGDIVSAFQKFAECRYTELSGQSARVNDFQIVEKGSNLFLQASGFGYSSWLTVSEIKRMNLFFQKRHLLEHNNGLVDQKYIDKSGDHSYGVGQRLVVREADSNELLCIIRKLGKGLLSLPKGNN